MEEHDKERRPSDMVLRHYKFEKTLGIGSSSKVKKAEHLLTGNKVAIKILNRHKIKKLDLEEKDHFWRQVLPQKQVVHWDLKPENLLLDSNLNIKIIDFGLGNEMRDGQFLKTSCGSPNYAAPEIISGKLYAGPEIDVWSCGVILYALLCGTLPFDDPNFPNLYKKIKSGMFPVPGHLSAGARDLIQRILTVDPLKRMTIPEIRHHPWIQVQLHCYLAMPPPDTMQQVKKVVKLGFERNQLIESLLNRNHDEDGGFFHTRYYETSTSAIGHSLQGGPNDQGTSCRPNFLDQNKWTFGIKSMACPCEIMIEIVRALTDLRVCWRNIGQYNLRCKWQPGFPGNSESNPTNPVHFDDRISNGFLSVENHIVPENQFNTVKFEIQIYKAMDEKFLLDVQRVEGPQLLFISLCASLLHQLRVR